MISLGIKSLFILLASSNKNIDSNMSSTKIAQKAVTVKIVSDIVWPFCFVGLRHLEAASKSSGIPVNLEWMPFLLNPNMPEEGESIQEHISKKYGPSAAVSMSDPSSHLKQMGRAVGIEFNDNRKMVNTKRAHALVEQLKNKGENDQANQFMEDLYKSYFVDGQDVNDEQWLMKAVAKYGVDENECAFALSDHNLAAIGKMDRDTKNKYGVNGVPFYMIYPKKEGEKPIAFSGAYPPEIIAEHLEEASSSN